MIAHPSEVLPTVKVVDPLTKRGWRIINASALTDAHTLYVEAGDDPASTIPADEPAEPAKRPRGRPRKVAA